MGVILDTSLVIAAERGRFDMAGYLAGLGDEPVALAAGGAVATLNRGEFARVPGLVLAPVA